MPTRNKCIYPICIEIRSSGSDEVIEDRFGIISAFEAFFAREVVEMHEKVIIGGRDVRSIWRMRQSLVARFIQLLQGQLSNMRASIVMEENWSLHIDQSRAHTLKLLVHFVNLSAVLRRNRFARIQEAVMDETDRRPSNSHHNLFLVQFRLREVLWSFSGIQPLYRTSPVVVEDPHVTIRSRNGSFLLRRRSVEDTSKRRFFFIIVQLMRHPFIQLFWLPYLL